MEKNDLRIRNLRYNAATFALTTTFTLSGLGLIAYAKEPIIDDKQMIEVAATDIKLENNHEKLTFTEPINTINVVYDEPGIEMLEEYEAKDKVITENNYSGMELSNEYEDEIKRLANLYSVPYEIVLTIGYRESSGKWDNNGVVSPTNDYGVFQINECNLEYIEENLGYSEEEILNNPVKNAEACMLILKDILKRDDVTTIEEIFGMYNGWVGWEDKPLAETYSIECCDIINEYFPDFKYIKEEKKNNL